MDYEKRIKELVQVASTLLDSNTKLGEKVDAQMKEIQFLRDEKTALNTKIEKFEGQLEDLNGISNLKENTYLCYRLHVRRIFVSALRKCKDIQANEYIGFGGFSSEYSGHATVTYLSLAETCKLLCKASIGIFQAVL